MRVMAPGVRDALGAPSVSIVICTLKRPDLLLRCLRRLASRLPAEGVEVIVVDNDAMGTARDAVERMRSQLPLLRYCVEYELGLSKARNRGLGSARGHYVAYLDDDALVSDTWFPTLSRLVREAAGDIIGGPYYPYYMGRRPPWFRDSYLSNCHGERARFLEQGETLSGANFAIRRSLAAETGGFAADYGLGSGRVRLGEETELQWRLRAQSPSSRVLYDPACSILHLTPAEYTTIGWSLRRLFAGGRAHYLLSYPSRLGLRQSITILVKAGLSLVLVIGAPLLGLTRSRQRYPDVRNHLWEVVLPRVVNFGLAYELFASAYRRAGPRRCTLIAGSSHGAEPESPLEAGVDDEET